VVHGGIGRVLPVGSCMMRSRLWACAERVLRGARRAQDPHRGHLPGAPARLPGCAGGRRTSRGSGLARCRCSLLL